MAIRRLKIKGWIEAFVNEEQDGEKFCHLMLDAIDGDKLLKALKDLTVWDMDVDDPAKIADKYKKHDYAGYDYINPTKVTGSGEIKDVKE